MKQTVLTSKVSITGSAERCNSFDSLFNFEGPTRSAEARQPENNDRRGLSFEVDKVNGKD